MLTLARAEAGTARLAFEPVDLALVVRTACRRARSLAEKHGHTIIPNLDDDRPSTVWGDYSSLHRLLWILLDNATKYTAAPGVIKVSLNANGKIATATVEDNGRGISPADLPHIFERFYRADPSRSEVEGSGVGLSIAKWIANAHQATLSVESQESVGTTFRVDFPLLAEALEMRPSLAS